MVSDGQTGADRAGLDWAIQNGIAHGGWCPTGRKAEDGVLDAKYLLTETKSSRYSERTRQNVLDSDGTLIVNVGALDGGTLKTVVLAKALSKPHLVLQLDAGVGDDKARELQDWLRRHSIATLNLAGPREIKRPGIYELTRKLLHLAADTFSYPLQDEKIGTARAAWPPDLGTYTPSTSYVVRKAKA
jgi:hypothetical protein